MADLEFTEGGEGQWRSTDESLPINGFKIQPVEILYEDGVTRLMSIVLSIQDPEQPDAFIEGLPPLLVHFDTAWALEAALKYWRESLEEEATAEEWAEAEAWGDE